MKTNAIIAQLLILLLLHGGHGVPVGSFFDHGTAAGDSTLSEDAVELPLSFKFLGSNYTTAYVSIIMLERIMMMSLCSARFCGVRMFH